MLSLDGLQQRALLLQAIRSFFINRYYIEVDTPIRLPVLLPESNIQPFASEDMYLQTSPELCMKMLLARGAQQLFQLCHCFRKEESGRFHHTEFTMLEWYHCGWDYNDLMVECEAFLQFMATGYANNMGQEDRQEIIYQGKTIALTSPWNRLSVEEAFREYVKITPADALEKGCFDQLLVECVEPHLGWGKPTFLYDYPVELASLARPKKDNPYLAERFELYFGGVELANGFSELVDARIQRQRFMDELTHISGRGEKMLMPERFLTELDKISETAGIAFGVDRLIMLLMGKEQLLEVLPFSLDCFQT